MNNKYDGTTSDLNISAKYLDCNDVLNTLYDCGIKCSVTPNKSIICNDNNCYIEKGCLIILNDFFYKEIEHKVWNHLNP